MKIAIKILIVLGIILAMTSVLYASIKRDQAILDNGVYDNCIWKIDIDGNYQPICE